MFQPRRLRTRRPSTVETSARKPSHFTSNDHPDPVGIGPERTSIGAGSTHPTLADASVVLASRRVPGVGLPAVTAPPAKVDWMGLASSREIVLHCGLRIAAGYDFAEVAVALNLKRPDVRHLELPETISKSWVQARMRDVRREILETNAASG